MNNQIQIFTNAQFGEIRTALDEITQEPWFNGMDVCNALGYTNTRGTIARHVDEGDVRKRYTPTTSGDQLMTYINESGLYSLILSSKLPQAKQFKHWVTSEVLPSIRKNGVYMTEAAVMKAITDPDSFIELAMNLKRQREEHKLILAEKNSQIAEMQGKVDYLDHIMESDDHMCISTIAVDYGKNAQEFNQILLKYGVLQRKTIDKVWQPTEEFRGKGYCDVIYRYNAQGKPFPNPELKWTHAGRKRLYDHLKKFNIVPVSERPKEPTLFDDLE